MTLCWRNSSIPRAEKTSNGPDARMLNPWTARAACFRPLPGGPVTKTGKDERAADAISSSILFAASLAATTCVLCRVSVRSFIVGRPISSMFASGLVRPEGFETHVVHASRDVVKSIYWKTRRFLKTREDNST